MKTFTLALFGVAVALAAVPGFAQSAGRQNGPDVGQSLVTPYIQPSPENPSSVNPVFHFGSLPVGIWAPVEPPYDPWADRNNAANPLWFDDGAP